MKVVQQKTLPASSAEEAGSGVYGVFPLLWFAISGVWRRELLRFLFVP